MDDTSTKQNIKFYESIDRKLWKLLLDRLVTNETKQKLLKNCLRVINQKILDVYEPHSYERTDNLINSFKVAGTKTLDSDHHLYMFSHPNIAPSWGDPSLSYAAYFETEEWNTFLLNKGAEVKPIRPFFEELVRVMTETVENRSLKALDAALREIRNQAFK